MNITLLSEHTVFEKTWYPEATFFRDGKILLAVTDNPPPGEGNAPVTAWVSSDKGERWHPLELEDIVSFHQLGGDTLMGLGGQNQVQDKIRLEQEYAPFIARVRTARSSGDLLSGTYEDDFVKVDIPNLGSGCGDADDLCTGVIYRGLVETPRGDLIMSMYGNFRTDRTRIPYFKASYQMRSWTCISRDRGRSWHYLSTIASSDRNPLPVLAEGYCEPDLLSLDDGGILAVARTGGNPSPDADCARYTALVACRSHDYGVTWEPVRQIAPWGVNPRLLRMQNGVIVCLSGRPGFFLLFSHDEGANWSEPYAITTDHRQWGQCSSGYGSIGELEPNVLTVFYDESVENDGRRIVNTKMRQYSIQA